MQAQRHAAEAAQAASEAFRLARCSSRAEITRISGPAGSAIPLDGPATMAFDDATKSLLVANHAILGDPADFAVLRIYVGEKGDPYPDADVDGHCGH